MNDADTAMLLRDGMLVMLKLAGPPLLATLVVGLLVALVQAITQINEATLAFVPRYWRWGRPWFCWVRSWSRH